MTSTEILSGYTTAIPFEEKIGSQPAKNDSELASTGIGMLQG